MVRCVCLLVFHTFIIKKTHITCFLFPKHNCSGRKILARQEPTKALAMARAKLEDIASRAKGRNFNLNISSRDIRLLLFVIDMRFVGEFFF